MRLQRLQYGIVISSILVSTLAWGDFDDGEPKNGLSSQAFRRNALTANQRALEILSSHALNDTLPTDYEKYIGRQLHDPNARAMMSEVVKCALKHEPGSKLTYRDPFDEKTFEWSGELGLCPDWQHHAPTQACQRLVTACVMARVNAMGRAIPLWLRGYPSELASNGPVHTVTELRERLPETDPAKGIPISSFDSVGSGCGADCDWKAAYVGKCRPGAPIGLRLEGPVNSDWQVRVCAGIHGCIAPTTAGSPPYTWRIGEFSQPPVGNRSPLLDFACPGGTDAGSDYSVMVRKSDPPGDDRPDMRSSSGAYPAPRKEVFPFLEGAFYGNLFDPDKLTQGCEVDSASQMTCRPLGDKRGVPDVCVISCGVTSCRRDAGALPYTNVYACYSLAQQDDSQRGNVGVAYLNSRICDRPDATCFPEPPGPCIGEGPDSARCTWYAGVYADCMSRGAQPEEFPPITTYLNEPCDLIGEGKLCDEVRSTPRSELLSKGARLCVAGGVLLLIVVGVLTGRLRDRKRRPCKDRYTEHPGTAG